MNRRLSFVEDQSLGNFSNELDKSRRSHLGPPVANAGERRQSLWMGAGGPRKSIFVGRRVSHSNSSRKSSQDLTYSTKVRLQNTYRTEPEENEKFQPYKIEPKLYALLENSLKEKVYDPNRSVALSKELSQDIMRETRNSMLNMSSRYKLVSHVVIGEMKGQDIRVGSRCVWNSDFDNSASVVYKNGSLYAVATVFAVYFE